MAAADHLKSLDEEATCSICLDYFKEPVSVECGHAFCKSCITRCWERFQTNFPCPQCRKTSPKVTLRPVRQLTRMVEIAKQLHNPSTTGQDEHLCRQHEEKLKLFCKNDQKPICLVCSMSQGHKGHNVVPIEEATQENKSSLQCRKRKMGDTDQLNSNKEAKVAKREGALSRLSRYGTMIPSLTQSSNREEEKEEDNDYGDDRDEGSSSPDGSLSHGSVSHLGSTSLEGSLARGHSPSQSLSPDDSASHDHGEDVSDHGEDVSDHGEDVSDHGNGGSEHHNGDSVSGYSDSSVNGNDFDSLYGNDDSLYGYNHGSPYDIGSPLGNDDGSVFSYGNNGSVYSNGSVYANDNGSVYGEGNDIDGNAFDDFNAFEGSPFDVNAFNDDNVFGNDNSNDYGNENDSVSISSDSSDDGW
ncbi:uncharacterized protein [Pleurodeles waltl]|uniref:uncharacterized protein isoform X1 n=2 Tax=Pleurodeles waltl TaxID=8319 RepID=UPI003709949A